MKRKPIAVAIAFAVFVASAAGITSSVTDKSSTTVRTAALITTSLTGNIRLAHDKTVVVLVSIGQPLALVAAVVGESYAKAVVLLKGFAAKEVRRQTSKAAPGIVIAQSPSAGAKARRGSTVIVTVAQAPRNVTVPYFYGDTAAAAGAALRKLSLQPLEVTATTHVNPQYNGLVIGQEPEVGASVPPGTTVEIRVEQYVALGAT
jgi:serine/threonine-protein kinase